MTYPLRQIVIVIFLFISSCADRNSPNKNKQPSSAAETSKLTATDNIFSTQNHLEVAQQFADNFQPDTFLYEGIGKIGYVPDSVIYAFKDLRHSDSASHKRYLTVVFLKLYLDHLRCCHQSYEVRNKIGGSIDSLADPLVYEYNLATGLFDMNKPIEFINSGIGETYVKKNRQLAEYPEIKELLNRMKPVKDSIEKHLYW